MDHNGSHIAAPALAIAYHSGFGHTMVLADAVAAGAREAGADVTVIAVDRMTETDWDILDSADGIVFGSATYMGNVSAGFQTFAEHTGRRCLNGTWRDKIAAGFTNSGAKSGDKLNTLCHLRCSPPSITCIGSTWVWVRAGTAPPVAKTTSTGSASGWARVRRPTWTPTRTRCIPPTCRRAAISDIESRW
jgi:flavodoxin